MLKKNPSSASMMTVPSPPPLDPAPPLSMATLTDNGAADVPAGKSGSMAQAMWKSLVLLGFDSTEYEALLRGEEAIPAGTAGGSNTSGVPPLPPRRGEPRGRHAPGRGGDGMFGERMFLRNNERAMLCVMHFLLTTLDAIDERVEQARDLQQQQQQPRQQQQQQHGSPMAPSRYLGKQKGQELAKSLFLVIENNSRQKEDAAAASTHQSPGGSPQKSPNKARRRGSLGAAQHGIGPFLRNYETCWPFYNKHSQKLFKDCIVRALRRLAVGEIIPSGCARASLLTTARGTSAIRLVWILCDVVLERRLRELGAWEVLLDRDEAAGMEQADGQQGDGSHPAYGTMRMMSSGEETEDSDDDGRVSASRDEPLDDDEANARREREHVRLQQLDQRRRMLKSRIDGVTKEICEDCAAHTRRQQKYKDLADGLVERYRSAQRTQEEMEQAISQLDNVMQPDVFGETAALERSQMLQRIKELRRVLRDCRKQSGFVDMEHLARQAARAAFHRVRVDLNPETENTMRSAQLTKTSNLVLPIFACIHVLQRAATTARRDLLSASIEAVYASARARATPKTVSTSKKRGTARTGSNRRMRNSPSPTRTQRKRPLSSDLELPKHTKAHALSCAKTHLQHALTQLREVSTRLDELIEESEMRITFRKHTHDVEVQYAERRFAKRMSSSEDDTPSPATGSQETDPMRTLVTNASSTPTVSVSASQDASNRTDNTRVAAASDTPNSAVDDYDDADATATAYSTSNDHVPVNHRSPSYSTAATRLAARRRLMNR